jgi:hypothetical protein
MLFTEEGNLPGPPEPRPQGLITFVIPEPIRMVVGKHFLKELFESHEC